MMDSSENRYMDRRRCNTSPDIIEGFEIQRRNANRANYYSIQSRDRSIRDCRDANRDYSFSDRVWRPVDRNRYQPDRSRYGNEELPHGRFVHGRFIPFRSELRNTHNRYYEHNRRPHNSSSDSERRSARQNLVTDSVSVSVNQERSQPPPPAPTERQSRPPKRTREGERPERPAEGTSNGVDEENTRKVLVGKRALNAPESDADLPQTSSSSSSSASSELKSSRKLKPTSTVVESAALVAGLRLDPATPAESASNSTKETDDSSSDQRSSKKREKKSKKQKKKVKKAKKKSSKALKSSKKTKKSSESMKESKSASSGSEAQSSSAAAVAGPSKGLDLANESDDEGESQNVGTDADMEAVRNRMAPMTKEQWERQQNTIRREVSPSTGRVRLIRGTGEVIEEIVTKDRHQSINTNATIADGQSFQATMMNQLNRK